MTTACPVCGSANDPRAQFCAHPGCGAYLGRDEDRGAPEEHVGGQLELATPRLAVAPGGAVTTELTVHNTGTMVERFHLWVVGDAGPWAQVEPLEVSAYPGDSATSAVTFTPPPPPTGPSGSIRFEVVADSTVHPSLQLTAPGTVTVRSSASRAVAGGGPSVTAHGNRIITPALAVWQLVLIGGLVLLVVVGFVLAGASSGGSYGALTPSTTGEAVDA